MLTYFKGHYGRYGSPNGDGYTENEYFTHHLDEHNILVTTRHRAWVILDPEEYDTFLTHRLRDNPRLFSLLEDLGIILTTRNSRDVAKLHCHRYSFLHRAPRLFIMVPTNRCNLVCTYCHAEARSINSTDADMSDEVMERAINYLLSVPAPPGAHLSIELQGGEPLLRYDLVQRIMDRVTELAGQQGRPASFTIVSNLTLMTDEIASDIRDRGNVRLCSSLDGPRSVHDRQRIYPGGQGTYGDVIRWAGRLQEEYSINVPFLLTMTTNGIGKEREIVEEYAGRALRSVYLRWVNAVGRAHHNGSKLCLSPAHVVSAWKTMLDAALEKNSGDETFVEQQTAYLLGNMLNASHSFMCLRRPCGCGTSQVVIGPDGTIHGCDGGRSVPMLALGNVLDDTYDTVFTSATARALRTLASEALPHCQECAFGPYCGYCVARGINQHGGPIPDIPADSECQIYREIIPYLFTKLLDRKTAIALNRWL